MSDNVCLFLNCILDLCLTRFLRHDAGSMMSSADICSLLSQQTHMCWWHVKPSSWVTAIWQQDEKRQEGKGENHGIFSLFYTKSYYVVREQEDKYMSGRRIFPWNLLLCMQKNTTFFFFYCALILWAKGADIWSIFVRVHLLNGRKLQVETEKAAEWKDMCSRVASPSGHAEKPMAVTHTDAHAQAPDAQMAHRHT